MFDAKFGVILDPVVGGRLGCCQLVPGSEVRQCRSGACTDKATCLSSFFFDELGLHDKMKHYPSRKGGGQLGSGVSTRRKDVSRKKLKIETA